MTTIKFESPIVETPSSLLQRLITLCTVGLTKDPVWFEKGGATRIESKTWAYHAMPCHVLQCTFMYCLGACCHFSDLRQKWNEGVLSD